MNVQVRSTYIFLVNNAKVAFFFKSGYKYTISRKVTLNLDWWMFYDIPYPVGVSFGGDCWLGNILGGAHAPSLRSWPVPPRPEPEVFWVKEKVSGPGTPILWKCGLPPNTEKLFRLKRTTKNTYKGIYSTSRIVILTNRSSCVLKIDCTCSIRYKSTKWSY